jgi:SAM-dependent methyltransferase
MTTSFFRSVEAARRYDMYRPQVHAIFSEWLIAAGLSGPYKHAIDIACGTGHSTLPLIRLADQVDAIDDSPAMVSVAKSKGLPARVASFSELPAKTYDLLSICMAFHWFERGDAIARLHAASMPGAVWLISNFALVGHASDDRFNDWYNNWYRTRFPAPIRGAPAFRPSKDEDFIVSVAEVAGTLQIPFDRQHLIGYLTTQSNVEVALRPGFGYSEAERELDERLPYVAEPRSYLYNYQYTICRVSGRADR